MSVVSAIRRMLDAGLTIEQALLAAEACEEEMTPARSKGAERQARYRERNKASQTVTGDACDDSDASPSPPEQKGPTPQKTQPPLPQKKTPPTGGQKKRGSPLPDDWEPRAEEVGLGKELGLDERLVREQADRFRDWAAANSNRQVGRKADWDRAFRNWLRSAAEQHKPRDGPRKNGKGWIIPPGCREWDAWHQLARRVNEERLLAYVFRKKAELKVPTRWPTAEGFNARPE